VKESGTKGDPKEVALLAEKAGIPAALRGVSVDDTVSSPKASTSPLPTPFPTKPFDQAALGSTSTAEASARSAEALRETEIAAKSPLVFDQSGASSNSAKTLGDPIQSLIEQERTAQAGRLAASAKGSDLSNLAGLFAGQNQLAQQSSSGKDGDKAFLAEYSSTRKDPGVRPQKPEASLVLTQGSVIEAVLLRELNSDLPGVPLATSTTPPPCEPWSYLKGRLQSANIHLKYAWGRKGCFSHSHGLCFQTASPLTCLGLMAVMRPVEQVSTQM